MMLSHLLAELDPVVRITVVGTDPDIVRLLASARPSAEPVVLPRVRSRSDLRSARTIWGRLRQLGPDIIQVNLPSPASARHLLIIAHLVPHARVIAVEHLPVPLHDPAARLVKRLTSRRLAAHLAVGNQTAASVEQIVGLSRGSVRVVPNGLPSTTCAATYRPGRAARIGTVGRLEARKGVDLLLTALEQLPGVHLQVLGKGPMLAGLTELARELGLGNRCDFSGWTEDVDSTIADWDVFVLASRAEGMPLAVLQAMHVGLPVVVTDVGSVREVVVHGVTGLVVPPESPAALVSALHLLISDAALRERLGRAGRERAHAHFGVAGMARGYERIYAEILGADGLGPQ